MPFGFIMPPLPAATKSLKIALVSNNTTDRREVEIHENAAPVILGRASRSKGKHLEAQRNNALFDCPVVSRLHAELRMVPQKSFEQPQLTIADLTSLHGTKVNGHPLKPGSPFSLQHGDVIKLGERVTRGDGMYSLLRLTSSTASSADSPLDAHEGVSLTFHHLPSPSTMDTSSNTDFMPTTSNRGFRAPSFSDASDVDSDHDISDGEHHTSSAKTTPEQKKAQLGSQNDPIALDTDPVGSDEDVTFTRRIPESNFYPAFITSQPTDFDRFSDGGFEHDARDNEDDDVLSAQEELSDIESNEDSDIDHDDDVDYGCDLGDLDDADDISNPASDLSLEADSEVDDEALAHRELSPELGIFDNVVKDTVAQPQTFAGVFGAAEAEWHAPASKQYDPVRNSLPVAEQVVEPHYPVGRTTTTPFTYGYPGFAPFPATNSLTSAHWDVQHPMHSYQPSINSVYQPVNTPYQPEDVRPTPNPQTLFPMSIDAIVEPLLPVNTEQTSKSNNDTINQIKSKVESVQDTTASSTIAEADPSNFGDSSNKRKRDTIDEAVDTPCPPAKKVFAPIRRRLAPSKEHRSVIRKAVLGATKATAYAAVGAIGTVAFLSSPMAESLIQWLG